jgi:hypothetical protein
VFFFFVKMKMMMMMMMMMTLMMMTTTTRTTTTTTDPLVGHHEPGFARAGSSGRRSSRVVVASSSRSFRALRDYQEEVEEDTAVRRRGDANRRDAGHCSWSGGAAGSRLDCLDLWQADDWSAKASVRDM